MVWRIGAVTFFLGILLTACGPQRESPAAVDESSPELTVERREVSRPPDEFIPSDQAPGRTHTVRAGETLYGLSRMYYGDEHQWRKIYYANQKRLDHPDQIPAGIRLIIP